MEGDVWESFVLDDTNFSYKRDIKCLRVSNKNSPPFASYSSHARMKILKLVLYINRVYFRGVSFPVLFTILFDAFFHWARVHCSCVIETTLLCENGRSVPRAVRDRFDISN